MKIMDTHSGCVVADHVKWARNYFTRLKGLMFKKSIKVGEGILLYPCNGIHMFFMKFPLDILFLDSDLVVIKQINGIKPGQISPVIKKARYILEVSCGTMDPWGNIEGHRLQLVD